MNEIIRGIESHWSGTYTVFGRIINLTTTIINHSDGRAPDNSQEFYCRVRSYDRAGVPHVTYSMWGWSRTYVGTMSMYTGDSRHGANDRYDSYNYGLVAAHEFGHMLGIDDLYNKPKKRFDRFGNIIPSIMNGNSFSVQSIDVEKMLLAAKTGKFQKW